MEYKLSSTAYESTFEFHEGREAAHHIEETAHKARFDKTIEYINSLDVESLSDLGAGDGGLLSRLNIRCWGYDFHIPNIEYARNTRNVDVRNFNFVEQIDTIELGEVVTITEAIEHLENPHDLLRRISLRGDRYLICSSPVNETKDFHCEEHVWAWDFEGYEALLKDNGWDILKHEVIFPFQIVLAKTHAPIV